MSPSELNKCRLEGCLSQPLSITVVTSVVALFLSDPIDPPLSGPRGSRSARSTLAPASSGIGTEAHAAPPAVGCFSVYCLSTTPNVYLQVFRQGFGRFSWLRFSVFASHR